MAEKRRVDDVIAPGEVGNVSEETAVERLCRMFLENIAEVAAILILVAGMSVAVVLIFTHEALRTAAFQLVNSCVAGAIGFLFGSKRR